jgi:hypothetical protein
LLSGGFFLVIDLKILQFFPDRVNHKPIIVKPPQNLTLIVGQSGELKCGVLSDLHLAIQWQFNNDSSPIKVMVVA